MNELRRRCVVLSAAMSGTSLLAAVIKPERRGAMPKTTSLPALFPETFGEWRTVGPINAFVRPAAEPIYNIYDQVLERTYVGPKGASLMLSVAYGGSQSNGLELHRPELCYKYSGFAVRGVRPDEVHTPDGTIAVNRVVAERPGRPEAITYWVLLGGDMIPDGNSFRLRTLSYAMRRVVVDGMLVRVSSIDPVAVRAYAMHDRFIGELVTAVASDQRAQIFGKVTA